MTTSNGRTSLQYAKYASLHPVPETRSLPDVGSCNERAFAPKPDDASVALNQTGKLRVKDADGCVKLIGGCPVSLLFFFIPKQGPRRKRLIN